jgi:hypothetical protein
LCFKKSPFENHFNNLLINADLVLASYNNNQTKEKTEDIGENIFFCPDAFLILKQELSIIPLWSGIMLNHFQISFPYNYSYDSFRFLTNKPVLSYFNILKQHILLKEKRFNLNFFVGKLYSELKRIYLKYYEKKLENNENNVEMKDFNSKIKPRKKSNKFVDKKEIWKGRGYKNTHKKVFSYFGSQLNEKDFSYENQYRFDFGYLAKLSTNYFEFIFDENIFDIKFSKKESKIYLKTNFHLKSLKNRNKFYPLFYYQQKRKKTLEKIKQNILLKRRNMSQISQPLNILNDNFILDVKKMKDIFYELTNQKNYDYIANVFIKNKNILQKTIIYLRKLDQNLFNKKTHTIYEDYSKAFVSQGYAPVNSSTDGNCLYNSFSMLFFQDQSFYFIYKLLSLFIMFDYHEELKVFAQNKDLRAFIIKSFREDEWGTDFNILSLSILLNTKIYVYRLNSNNEIEYTTRFLNNMPSPKKKIFLVFVYLQNNKDLGHFFPLFFKNIFEISDISLESNVFIYDYTDKEFEINKKNIDY